MDEPAAIRAAMAGDREAFAILVGLHQARLRALTALAIPNRDDVHDVVQEAFIDAWRGLPGFDAQREFGPWLRTICRNRMRQFLRNRLPRRRRELALVDEALLAGPQPAEPDDTGERSLAALRHCVGGLAEAQRRLLDLRYRDDVAVQDIATSLGRSPNSVSMTLLRLKAALGRCVADRLGLAAP